MIIGLDNSVINNFGKVYGKWVDKTLKKCIGCSDLLFIVLKVDQNYKAFLQI